MRACRELGLATVAVYSDCDRMAPHVRYADEAIGFGANESGESYLRIGKLVEFATRVGADAVHPGYGFLAENAAFARACTDAGLRFIGPHAEVIELMGGKTASREAAARAGVPIVPGTDSAVPADASDDAIQTLGDGIGYPLFVKAVAGGGGKGMRLVREASALAGAVHGARSEAISAFGNGDVYFERCIERGRHIEVQLLGDEYGTVIPFVERECSIQRRHQKVIEETPSVAVNIETRRALAGAAVSLATSVGYTNAGTIEFLLDPSGEFYFLEMNTRLQVEHPVTEMVTGIDLVRWQLKLAQGERLAIDADRGLEPHGHAIECRVYAEDPEAGFMPCPGLISSHQPPAGPGIRVDAGVDAGFEVPVYYDSMISKLIAWGSTRSMAIDRMQRALSEYEISGVKTTVPMFRWVLRHSDFIEGRFDTNFLETALATRGSTPFVVPPPAAEELTMLAVAVDALLTASGRTVGREAADRIGAWKRAARLEGLR